MDVVINEYIHENFKVNTTNGFCKVFYEPCENRPVSNLTGLIYVGTTLTQTFYTKQERELVPHSNYNKKYKAINGIIIPEDGQIVLIWDKYPGEHFLCVSYEHVTLENIVSPQTKWITEGF